MVDQARVNRPAVVAAVVSLSPQGRLDALENVTTLEVTTLKSAREQANGDQSERSDMFKDTIDEAMKPGGVYGTDPAVSRPVDIKPAETDVTPVERAARDAYAAELDARADAIPDPETSREMRARAGRVRDSLPILEMFGRLREIAQARDDMGDVPVLLPRAARRPSVRAPGRGR